MHETLAGNKSSTSLCQQNSLMLGLTGRKTVLFTAGVQIVAQRCLSLDRSLSPWEHTLCLFGSLSAKWINQIVITPKRFHLATNKSLICICVPPRRTITADLFKRDAKTSDKTLLCRGLMTVVNLISLGWNKILILCNDSPKTPLYPDRLCVCVC